MIYINKDQKEKNNVVKDEIIQQFKNILMRPLKKILIISIIVILILFLISAAIYHVFQEEGIWKEAEKGNPSTYTKNTQVSGEEGIYVEMQTLINETLMDMGFNQEEIDNLTDEDIIRILKMEEKLDKKIVSLDLCTHAEILWCTNEAYSKYLKTPEDLQKLLNAELITQYPQIEGLAEDKLNGIITFERYTVDLDSGVETVKTLTYISSEEFTNKMESYQQTGNEEVFDYFTLDDQGNAKVATWTREEGKYNSTNTAFQTDRKKIRQGVTPDEIKNDYDERYNVTKNDGESIEAQYISYYAFETLINYKTLIQQYTLPFEYLWSLLVMGKSDEFVLQLADLAYNSEITIGVFDNIDKTVITDEETYTEQFKEWYKYYEDGNLQSTNPSEGESQIPESYDYLHKNVITTYYDQVQVEVIHADTWIVEVTVQYENNLQQDNIENQGITSENQNEEWQDDISPNPYIETWTEEENIGTDEFGEPIYETINCKKETYKYKRTINKSIISKQDVTNRTYQRVNSIIKEKVDTDPSTDMNFVKLFLDDENVRNSLSDPASVEWLISILSQNDDTKNMTNLTKFLIYKATNNEALQIDFNFNIFDTTSFNSVTSIYGGDVEEKVWFALIDAGYSEYAAAGAMGSIAEESGFKTNNVQNSTESRVGSDEEYTAKINNNSYSEEDFASDKAGYGLCQWTYKTRKRKLYQYAMSKGVSIDNAEMQIMFFLGELTGKGDAASFTTRIISGIIKSEGIVAYHDDWANATSVDDAALQFMRFFESPANKSSLAKRQTSAQRYYDRFHGQEKPIVGGENWSGQGVSCPRYYQSGQSWSYYPYNYKKGGTISSGGCGACALAMAVSGLTKQQVTPDEIVSYLNSINTDTVNNGTKSAKAVAEKYGLTYSQISRTDKTAINNALDSGKCLIFSIKANGIYTGGGHYIMVHGRSQNSYFVLESGHYYKSETGYAFNQVFTKGNQGVFVLGK